MKFYLLLLTSSLIVGCSGLKPLSDDNFSYYSVSTGALQKCFESGKISPKLYADAGRAYSHALSTSTYDKNKFNSAVEFAHSKIEPTPQICRQAEANAHKVISESSEFKEKMKADAAALNDAQKERRRNRTIYCNKVGSTTICN